MDAQFKKGVLELCLLQLIAEGPKTPFDLLEALAEPIGVNVNTIYPLLRRLESEGRLTHQKHREGPHPPRKQFTLTEAGEERLLYLKDMWRRLSDAVEQLLGGHEDEG